MPRFDRQTGGYRVFLGGVDPRVGKVDIEREFDRFGPIVDVWVARSPPGFAFIVFKYAEDADRAVRRMDGSRPFGSRLRVEHAVNKKANGGRQGRSRSRSRDRRRRDSPARFSGSRRSSSRRQRSLSNRRREQRRSDSRSYDRSRNDDSKRRRSASRSPDRDRKRTPREDSRKDRSRSPRRSNMSDSRRSNASHRSRSHSKRSDHQSNHSPDRRSADRRDSCSPVVEERRSRSITQSPRSEGDRRDSYHGNQSPVRQSRSRSPLSDHRSRSRSHSSEYRNGSVHKDRSPT